MPVPKTILVTCTLACALIFSACAAEEVSQVEEPTTEETTAEETTSEPETTTAEATSEETAVVYRAVAPEPAEANLAPSPAPVQRTPEQQANYDLYMQHWQNYNGIGPDPWVQGQIDWAIANSKMPNPAAEHARQSQIANNAKGEGWIPDPTTGRC